MEDNVWTNIMSEEKNNLDETIAKLQEKDRKYGKPAEKAEQRPRRGLAERTYVPFNDTYDFNKYESRVENGAKQKLAEDKVSAARLKFAKGIIGIGMVVTLILGGTAKGKIISDEFSNLEEITPIEQIDQTPKVTQIAGTEYPSKAAYDAGLTPEQINEMNRQNQIAASALDKLASGKQDTLTEEEQMAIKTFNPNDLPIIPETESLDQTQLSEENPKTY